MTTKLKYCERVVGDGDIIEIPSFDAIIAIPQIHVFGDIVSGNYVTFATWLEEVKDDE